MTLLRLPYRAASAIVSFCFSGKIRLLVALSLVYMGVRLLLDYHKRSLHEQLRNELDLAKPRPTSFPGRQHLRGFLNGFEQEGSQDIIHVVPSVAVGEHVPNCGRPSPCPPDSFSAHLFTGVDHHDQPKVCVDGKYIVGNGLNNGGRGINMVVLDTVNKHVQRVVRFDTYQEDSSLLESLLLNLRTGDIVLLVTFDEPTKKLSSIARSLFLELGSALSQNLLYYRSSWYLATQKGINGFTPYEDLHTVLSKGWPPPHDVRFCIPFRIQGMPVHPDLSQHDNSDRMKFCSRHNDVIPSFCTGDAKPAQHLLQKTGPSDNKLATSPVVVIAGTESRYLPQTLDTLSLQSGLQHENVLVFHEAGDIKAQDLCELFNFTCQLRQGDSSGGSCELLRRSMDTTETIYPKAPYMTIIEADVLLGSDFLQFVSSMVVLLDQDSTIGSISGFNPDGFHQLADDKSQAYRIQGIPGAAFVVRRGFSAKDRCSGDQWDSVIPEVSRALPISQDVLHRHNIYLGSPVSWPLPSYLEKANYDQWLLTNIRQSVQANIDLDNCQFKGLPHNNLPSSQVITVIFEQSSLGNESRLLELNRKCFHTEYLLANYRGVYRLHFLNHHVFLTGTMNPFIQNQHVGTIII